MAATGKEECRTLKTDTSPILRSVRSLSICPRDVLPADMTPQQACAGFKTLEQCITAIHLAQNLKLPFADLKAKTTGKRSVGLQKAIEQMAANANPKDELKKAKKQAADDMKGTNLFGWLSIQDQMVPLSKLMPEYSSIESRLCYPLLMM